MPKPNKKVVSPDGSDWTVSTPGKRPSVRTDTQKEAIDQARIQLENQGGGELQVKNRQGQVRQQDTIPKGNDPRSSKG